MSARHRVVLAGPADAAVVAGLVRAAFAEYDGVLVPPSGALRETGASIADELALPGHGALLALGPKSHAPVGTVLFRPRGADLYIGRLSVLPAYRGLGIARLLVGAAEDEARTRGHVGVALAVRIALEGNQRLFLALGYRETGRQAHPGFAAPTWIDMRKDIGPPATA